MFTIVHLPKEEYKDTMLPISYTTEYYYDVKVTEEDTKVVFSVEKCKAEELISHTPEEYDFPDTLYADYRENASAWGVIENGELIAAIETMPEEWSNRLVITELWIAPRYQKQGLGRALMDVAKEQARLERRRAIILETQSCNVNAFEFYRHQGFHLVGLDTIFYSNRDIDRREVYFEMGYQMPREKRLALTDIVIRRECETDYYAAEEMTMRAFWNKHKQGCDEHYLVHKLHSDESYLPELSRIAVKDGEVIGGIWYSKAKIVGDKETYEVLTFGPLCVEPKWQGTGVGEMLLTETIELARQMKYPGIVIFGEPDYYPRHGFVTCDKLGLTTPDGKNFDAFMGYVLDEKAMAGVHGKFYEGEVFENLPAEEVAAYTQQFPPLSKQWFPCQW